VVCDRYLASTLVLQGRDGLPQPWLLAINEHIDPPGLAIVLTAAPGILASRLDQRGRRDRFEDEPAPPGAENAMFTAAADLLAGYGVAVIRIDTSHLASQEAAARIADAVQERCASLTGHG
jgi:dTMP kinase